MSGASTAEPRARVAVVGGGIAGLAAGWWLARAGLEVTLFERHAEPGFVAHAVRLPGLPDDAPRVDVPLRVFYPGYYPTLVRLYQEAGVASEAVSYASSFHDGGSRAYFRYRNLRRGTHSVALPPLADLARSRARRIALGAWRFAGALRRALAAGRLAGCSIGEFADAERLDPAFVDGLLLPAIGTIATCTHAAARAMPAPVVAGYLLSGIARESVRRACGGADEVARRLGAPLARRRLGARVASLVREAPGAAGGHAAVALREAGGSVERFDHVVLATQADQALGLLADASPAEAALLSAFAYAELRVTMHHDTALLPPDRRDWSAVNLFVHPAHAAPESTIWIDRVMPGLPSRPGAAPVLQTVMPARRPRDELVVAEAVFQRPLVTTGSAAALPRLAALHAEPGRQIWFCGSYAEAGVPLLESAVRSAWQAAQGVLAALGRGSGGPRAARQAAVADSSA
jgi:predicted NAD/FAD-binding protein